MHNKPLISIVVLNWNSHKYIHHCMESVLSQDYTNYEVIFVDNNSTDSSLKECMERYPQFNYIENHENLGFAAGMNVGISHAKGDFVLLLNTDVYLKNNYVESCVRLMEQAPELVCTAGWEYKWRNFELTDEKVCGALGIRYHLRVTGTDDDDREVFGVSGSFPVFRMSTVKEIIRKRGFFFDEKFETGWEDTELRFFMMFSGYITLLNKNTIAWHVGSASDNENTRMFEKNLNYQTRIFRNRMYVIDRYIKKFFPIWYLYVCIINVVLIIFVLIWHRDSFKSYLHARKMFKEHALYRKEQRLIVKKAMNLSWDEIKHFIIGW